MSEETKHPTTTDAVTERDKGRCAPASCSADFAWWSKARGVWPRLTHEETFRAGWVSCATRLWEVCITSHESKDALIDRIKANIVLQNADLSDRDEAIERAGAWENAFEQWGVEPETAKTAVLKERDNACEERDKWRSIADDLVKALRLTSRTCLHLNHSKKDQHDYCDKCPPEETIKSALNRFEEARK
jgi:hypothetical protein